MHTSHLMVLIAALLPYATIGAAKAGKGYDNADPRNSVNQMTGLRARADWCHKNHFEAFPAFAAAVIIAEISQAPQGSIDRLAMIFIAFRVAYTVVYLANQATIRTLVWVGGFICMIRLFTLAL